MKSQKVWTWFEQTLIGQVCGVFIAAAIFWTFAIPLYWVISAPMDGIEQFFYRIHLGFLVEWFENNW